MASDNKPKLKRGRPPLPLPEAINRPMDEIAAVVLSKPPSAMMSGVTCRSARRNEARTKGASDGVGIAYN